MAYVLSFSVCFFTQKTAYEVRISDWSSDVCSSDLKICPNGSLYRSAVNVWRPGLVPMNPSLPLCVRYSGTNTPLTTISLEPLPLRPITCQVSTISKSDFGNRNVRYSGGWPSVKIRPPRKIQSKRSEERRVGKECGSTCRYRGVRDT